MSVNRVINGSKSMAKICGLRVNLGMGVRTYMSNWPEQAITQSVFSLGTAQPSRALEIPSVLISAAMIFIGFDSFFAVDNIQRRH